VLVAAIAVRQLLQPERLTDAPGAVIVMFGGIGRAASVIALVYVVGLVVTPFAGPETKGHPLPE